MTNIFATTREEFEQLEIEYNLENCGMSGRYYGWHWYCDDDANVNVYVRYTT